MLGAVHTTVAPAAAKSTRGATDASVGIGDEDDTATEGIMEAEGVEKKVGVVAFCERRFIVPHH